ncbi:uncharacterized protein LOC62_03G004843 [Vanrija pseudolonga]|uniref:Uncharacterized protein n=1 Tax=Vanrija pseudolonga TaxID=143232 RepID=A0AAF1BKQ4_9TREE|nr:hypothetical protein LOC62_03G004843 [Vanrija pseudolonga]
MDASVTPIYQQHTRKPDEHPLASDTQPGSVSAPLIIAERKHTHTPRQQSIDKPLPAVPPADRVLEPEHTLSSPILSPFPSINSMLDMPKPASSDEAQPHPHQTTEYPKAPTPEPLVPIVETLAGSPTKVVSLGDSAPIVTTSFEDVSPTGTSFVEVDKAPQAPKSSTEDEEQQDGNTEADESATSRRIWANKALEIGVTTTTSANAAGTDAKLDDDDDRSYLYDREFIGLIADSGLKPIKAEAEDDAEADAKLAGTSYVRGKISAQIDDDLDGHDGNGVLDAIIKRQNLKREAREQAAAEASGAGAAGVAAEEAAGVAKVTDEAKVAHEAEAADEDQAVHNVEAVVEDKTVDDTEAHGEAKAVDEAKVDEAERVDDTKVTREVKSVEVDEPAKHNTAPPAVDEEATEPATVEAATTLEVHATEPVVDNESTTASINDAENSTSNSPASAHLPITPVTLATALTRDDVEVGEADELPESGEHDSLTEEHDKRSLLEVDLEGKDGGEASGRVTDGQTASAALAATAAVAVAAAVPVVAASAVTATQEVAEALKAKETAPIVTDSPPADTPTALATEASLIVPQNTPAVTDAPTTFITPAAVNIADLNKNVLVNTSPALQRVEEMGNLKQDRQATPPPAYEEQVATPTAHDDDHLTIRPARETDSTPTAHIMMSIPSIRSVPSIRSIRSVRSEVAPEEHELFEAGEADEDTATGALAYYGTVAPDHGSPAAVAWAAATRERQRRKMKTLLMVAVPIAALLYCVGVRVRNAKESAAAM